MFVYRMHSAAYPVFDTTGSFLHPGRWHQAGSRVVYAAEHASLAVLETLIHAAGRKLPPRVLTTITIPDNLKIETASWLDSPASQAFGKTWLDEQRTAILQVPSIAVNRLESNFLFNPGHADFAKITHTPPQPFAFDPRFILFP